MILRVKRKIDCRSTVIKSFYCIILFLCATVISLESYAVPSVWQCRNSWRLTNITPGMQFGDFAISSGSGTITLTGGSSRTAGGAVDLASAGHAVNSHQISITNTRDPACAIYGIVLEFRRGPESRPMTGPGSSIPMTNVLVYVPGESGSPFTLPTPTLYLDPTSLPVTIEITAQMDTAFPQTGGLYRSRQYSIQLTQRNRSVRSSGRADTFVITPLTLSPGLNMDFGQIASGSSGGAITLDATSGTRIVTSGNADVVSGGTPGTPGTFTIQGNTGLSFNVSYGNGLLTDASGGNGITISNFTDTTAAMILTGGADTFSVGATITLTGSQPAGSYSTANPGGSPYTITVNYN